MNLIIIILCGKKWVLLMIEAALSNLFVIASDCPNGPKEFLNDGKNGLFFSK